MKKILKDFYSLCVTDDEVYGLSGDRLMSYSIVEQSYSQVAVMDLSVFEMLIVRSNILKRLLRYIPRAMTVVSDNEFCFVLKRKLYKVMISERKIICLHANLKSSPLNLTLSNCKKYVLFGDYNANEEMAPVDINFVNMQTGELQTKPIFERGDVNHIHNILPYKNGYIVLTGDTGSKTGFYLFDKDFVSFKCLFSQGQLSRACWLNELNDIFYFATDSQYEPNFLVAIDLDDGSYSPIASIENSSIYSCARRKKIYFSTTVEPGYNNHNFALNVIDDRIGNGIISRYSRLYSFDGQFLNLVDKQKKDFLPMRLFQFGVFTFPDFMTPDDDLLVYNCLALRGLSCSTVILDD